MRQLRLVVLLAACASNRSASVAREPPDPFPLPPDPSTSVGLLIANQAELELHDEQLTALQALENELQARNKPLDEKLRAEDETKRKGDKGDGTGPGPPGGGRRGAMGGGMRGGAGMGGPPGGGMGGGGSGGPPPGGGGMRGGGGGPPPGGRRPDPEGMRRAQAEERALQAKKAENNARVLEKAWELLDAAQRVKARAILDEAGHDAPP